MKRTARMRGDAALILLVLVGLVVLVGLIAWVTTAERKPQIMSNEVLVGMTQHRLVVLETALLNFKRDVGRFPTQSEGLKALVMAPEGVENYPENGYLEAMMLEDGWGNAFVYRLPAETGVPVIISGGSDGKIDGTGPPADMWIHPAVDVDANVPDVNSPMP